MDTSFIGMFGQVKAYATILYQFSIFFLLYYLVDREQGNLNNEYVKSRIGNLYEGLNPEKPGIKYYGAFFFARRTFFVAITFALFEYPVLQIMAFV